MATKLVDFIYATMYKRINNPDSPYWLPTVLKDVRTPDGQALNPLTVEAWDIGQLDGTEGKTIGDAISSAWWIFVGAAFDDAKDRGVPDLPDDLDPFNSQRDADHPYPSLSLTTVTVDGLANASVGELQNLAPTDKGYRGTVRVTTAAYDTHGWQKQITVKGTYSLVQHVVVIDDTGEQNAGEDLKPPTKVVVKGLEGVEWPRQEIEGHGQFTVTAQDLAFDVVLRAEPTGTGVNRTPQLTVESITVASQPTFHLDEKSLTIEGSTIDQATLEVWKQAAADAFNSDDAGKALAAKLVDTLAAPSFRDQFSATLTGQLAKALDGVLGAVPQGNLPSDDSGFPAKYGPLEIYLFDRLRACVNDTGSGFYPPTVVLGASDPVLEPYDVGDIDLGSHKIGVVTADLSFKGGTIKGISNLLIPVKDAALTDGGIGATLRFGRLPGAAQVPAPPLTITGTGVISFPDSSGSAVDDDDTIKGDLTVTIDQPTATAALSFTGRDADELTIGLDALALDLVTKDLQVAIHLQEPSPLEKIIQKVLNSDEVKQRIITGVQGTADSHRGDIAKELTANARTVIRAKLGG
ncbi:hypothetical protein [Kitasatospora kifunensis]|uniref:Uncharacterized protein n=1 Tax=Kitasatospora kifunensis TaxID=58351 RepID=A0A7W7VZT2_KITKI|nr:hypothetical protein [Kitasatospora kifunensis]MBB4928049.1 hypothetical protein [Kitasatospora kifunensis]